MKNLFLILSLFLTFNLQAQGFGNQSCAGCITVGGRVINLTNPNIKMLTANHNTSGYDTFSDMNGTAYQVPASTQAVFLAIRVRMVSGSISEPRIMYTDDIRDNISTAPTNPVYHTGTVNGLAGNYAYLDSARTGSQGNVIDAIVNFAAPTGKYITHASTAGVNHTHVTLFIGECPDTGDCEFE